MPSAAARKRVPLLPSPRTRLLVDERREQLVVLGVRAFGGRPYDEVSIDDLARAAKISKGLLYHYFPTKRDFYVAAIEHASAELLRRTETSPELPPEARVRRSLEAYLDFAEGHERSYVALMSGGIGADDEVAGVLARTRATIVLRIATALPRSPGRAAVPVVLRVALRGWIGFVEAATTDWLQNKSLSRKRLVDLFTRVLLASLEAAKKPDAAR